LEGQGKKKGTGLGVPSLDIQWSPSSAQDLNPEALGGKKEKTQTCGKSPKKGPFHRGDYDCRRQHVIQRLLSQKTKQSPYKGRASQTGVGGENQLMDKEHWPYRVGLYY